VALELALLALGIKTGDEVIVTCRTFLASVSTIVNVGATPVFADVDSDSQNITAETIQAVMTPKTKAILCVHLAGWPCDMDAIMALSQQHQLWVIEDCAQAHGAQYKGRSVGTIGHIGAWSFCQDKIMTTGGEGGMVTTHDKALWQWMWSYKDHGKSWEMMYDRARPPATRWVHAQFGTNWRMTEIQAVIGQIQLTRMPQWHAIRLQHATQLWQAAASIPALRIPVVPEHSRHAAYKAYVFVQPEKLASGWDRDRVMATINAEGVPCCAGSCPEIYMEPAFDETSFRPAERLPIAKTLGETSLMFLVHPTLTAAQMEKTCQVLQDVLAQASTPE
jgi:dTDP-4-amino-4,6-dideoxygalactose transaminase